MWNSFWWWRDQFNSEVQLKDRIGWEGNIKNSPLNCQWRSVSLKCMACDRVWLSGHVLCFVGWILRVHPIDAHFWKKYKIILLNNLIIYFMGKHAFRMARFQCLAKRLFRGFAKYSVYNLCEAVRITTSTERNFRNFVSHLTSNLPPKHVTVSQTPCDIISFNCQGQP